MIKDENRKRFNEVQPNSEQREEFLIVLEFLKNIAVDRNHATTQADIVKYAKNKYHKYIRRERVGQILIHIEQLSRSGMYSLPFKLEIIELNKTKKYYISQRQFTNGEIVKILTAIQKDKLLSDDETKRLAEKILSVSTTKQKGMELYSKIFKTGNGNKKTTQEVSQTYIDFVNACLSNDRIIFELKDPEDVNVSGSRISGDFLKKEMYGFAYRHNEIDKEQCAIIYLDNEKQVLVTKIDNLKLKGTFSVKSNPENFILNDKNFSHIDNWLEKYYSGKYGKTIHFRLKITLNSQNLNIKEFTKSYKEYWKEDLKYEVVDREVKLLNNEVLIAKDAIFELDANLSSFRKWYVERGNFDKVVILEPGHFNDFFMASRIQRYANRLTKYGTEYNYTLGKEYKVEYKEELDRRNHIYDGFKNEIKIVKSGGIPIYLGHDSLGARQTADLKSVKNLVGVGAAGSGKSVYLHTVYQKLISKSCKTKIKFCFIDPKGIEFYAYRNAPNLFAPLADSRDKTLDLLDKLIKVSEERIKEQSIPFHIIVFVDEYANLFDSTRGKINTKFMKIMQNTDKNGIHFFFMSQIASVFSDEMLDLAPTRINLMVFDTENTLKPFDSSIAINLIGRGDGLVYNKEVFGNEPKPMKVICRRLAIQDSENH